MRTRTRFGLVVLLAVVVAGCGAHPESTVSADDLQRIAAVSPQTPGWDWPKEPLPTDAPPPRESPLTTETPTATSSDALADAFDKGIRDAGGIVAGSEARWQDENKLGVTLAWLLNSPAGASTVLAANRVFAHGWAERTVGGGKFTDVLIEALGDEAWRVQNDFPGGQESTYGWRRASLVMQVHIQCIFQTCPSDISLAARAWADEIDKVAVDALAK